MKGENKMEKVFDFKKQLLVDDNTRAASFVDHNGREYGILAIDHIDSSFYVNGINLPVYRKSVVGRISSIPKSAIQLIEEEVAKLSIGSDDTPRIQKTVKNTEKNSVFAIDVYSEINNILKTADTIFKDPMVGTAEERNTNSIFGDNGLVDVFESPATDVVNYFYDENGNLVKSVTRDTDTRYHMENGEPYVVTTTWYDIEENEEDHLYVAKPKDQTITYVQPDENYPIDTATIVRFMKESYNNNFTHNNYISDRDSYHIITKDGDKTINNSLDVYKNNSRGGVTKYRGPIAKVTYSRIIDDEQQVKFVIDNDKCHSDISSNAYFIYRKSNTRNIDDISICENVISVYIGLGSFKNASHLNMSDEFVCALFLADTEKDILDKMYDITNIDVKLFSPEYETFKLYTISRGHITLKTDFSYGSPYSRHRAETAKFIYKDENGASVNIEIPNIIISKDIEGKPIIFSGIFISFDIPVDIIGEVSIEAIMQSAITELGEFCEALPALCKFKALYNAFTSNKVSSNSFTVHISKDVSDNIELSISINAVSPHYKTINQPDRSFMINVSLKDKVTNSSVMHSMFISMDDKNTSSRLIINSHEDNVHINSTFRIADTIVYTGGDEAKANAIANWIYGKIPAEIESSPEALLNLVNEVMNF